MSQVDSFVNGYLLGIFYTRSLSSPWHCMYQSTSHVYTADLESPIILSKAFRVLC